MEEDDDSIELTNRRIAYVNHKRTRKHYKRRINFEIEDETYNLKTKEIEPTRKKIKINNRVDWRGRYDPSELLKEDEGSLRNSESFDHRPNNPITTTGLYEQHKRLCELIGDIPFEFQSYLRCTNFNTRLNYKIDKTTNRPRRLTLQQIEDRALLPGEFFLRPKDYHQVTRNIATATAQRADYKLHKSVNFQAVISYIAKDKPCPPSHFLRTYQDFQHIGDPADNNFIVGTTYRLPRELQEENRPQSILKIPTPAEERRRYWKTRLEFTNPDRDTYFGYDNRHQIYNEIWRHQNNLQEWFDTTTKLTQSKTDSEKSSNDQYFYYINRKFRNELVEEAEQNFQKYSTAQNILAKFYHCNILNRYGSRFVYAPELPKHKYY